MACVRILRLACLLVAAMVLAAGCSPLVPGAGSDPPAADTDAASEEDVYQSAGDAPGEDLPEPVRAPASRGPTAAPRRDAELPTFEPWPPPTPTSQDTIARALVVGDAATTWGAVSDRFDAALAAAGYEDRSYYAVPDGFALATRIERIDRDGHPLAEPTRWVGSGGHRAWTLEAVLRELAGVPVGRYRTLVFVFSATPFRSRPAPVSEEMAERWRADGLNRLPGGLRALPYGDDFRCDVLVYEFQQGAAGEPATFVEAGLSARRHLAASLILDRLETTP